MSARKQYLRTVSTDSGTVPPRYDASKRTIVAPMPI